MSTAGPDGETWEYKLRSGGASTLDIDFELSPSGKMTGSFELDPGALNYTICEAEAAKFFSLPSRLNSEKDSVMLHGPNLRISITRAGVTKTVQIYDPDHVQSRAAVASFMRVWDRALKPFPLQPKWRHASN